MRSPRSSVAISLFALLLLGVLPALPAVAADFGSVTNNGVQMPVRGVVAVLDAARPGLTFYLLPYEPSPEEILKCRKNDIFHLNEGNPSPNPAKWPEWTPYVTYQLSWSFEPAALGDPSKATCWIYAYGIGSRGANVNLNYLDGKHQVTLKGTVKEGEEVELVATAQDTLGDDKLAWDLKLRAKVVTMLKE